MAKRITPDNVIDLTLDSDDEQESWLGDIRKNLYPRTPQMKKKKIKTEGSNNIKTEGSNSKSNATAASKYDEVEIVDAPDAQIAEEVAANDAEADGEVLMVGTVNETRLPHMRQHCTKFKFEYIRYHVPFITLSNALHCDLCYCYVCDKPAKECAVSFVSTEICSILPSRNVTKPIASLFLPSSPGKKEQGLVHAI